MPGRSRLLLVNPKSVIERGYAIVRDRHGKVMRSPSQATAGDRLDVELAEGAIRVRVEEGNDRAGGLE